MLIPTTKLEAVNTMLSCIGESPVNTIEVTDLEQVASALAILDEVSREVQEIGWYFNTETNYPLLRQVDTTISLPANTLKVDTTPRFACYEIVQRGTSLYDAHTHSYFFDKNLEVEITFALDWEQLPQCARNLIMIRAARRFQTRELGSESSWKFSETDEMVASAHLESAEHTNGDYNMITDSYSTAFVVEDRPF